ncbi:MAG: GPR endopeptidase [Eubacterium sp.]|nr:GPR endopeptidase [Eubacterium sp.]
MFFTSRTDLALEFSAKTGEKEGVRHTECKLYGMDVTETELSEETAEKLGKAAGHYYTLYSEQVPDFNNEIYALSVVLRKLLPQGKCLAVGLGNPDITADSLGWKAAEGILATSQFEENGLGGDGIGSVSVIRTNVSSNSGIDSSLQAKLSAEGIGADYIIAVDSLACSSPKRLCSTIQVTDTGICPGSGAGNPRKRLDKSTAGIPVIAIGVPTAMEHRERGECYTVTRRDADSYIRRYSYVISRAINRVLSPALSEDDCRMLKDFS